MPETKNEPIRDPEIEPVHIYATNDWFEHVLEDCKCSCKPRETINENGVSEIIHNSFDGREHLEPDHDWHNCEVCQKDLADLETTTNGW